ALPLAAAVVALVGLAARVWVAAALPLSADEAITGLMSKDVLRGELWWLVAGNAYGGTAESFLAAPLLALFPASEAALRGVSIALWAAAAVLLGLSARRLVDAPTALVAAGTYWLFSWFTIALSIRAYAGYAAGAAAFAGWLLLQIDDVSTAQEEMVPRAPRCSFVVRRVTLGVLAGFAVWQHPVFLAALVPGLLMAAASQRRQLLRWALPVGCGVLIGVSPLLLHNILHSWPSLTEPPTPAGWTYPYRLANLANPGLSRVLGLRFGQGPSPKGEALWVGGLWARALAVATGLLVLYAFALATRRPGAARLIGVTGLASPFLLVLFRNGEGRHAALFYPFLAILAVSLAVRDWRPAWCPRPIVVATVPLVWALVFSLPGLLRERRHEWPIATLPRVLASLDAAGVRFVRGDHWVVYPLTFETDERIEATEHTLVRFPRYEVAVTHAGSDVAYIFREDSPEKVELRESLASDPRYRRQEIGVWTLFLRRSRPAA
ncbi:MAG: hypothetical protein ACRDHY_17755, partial [Anaerolineales bacterium]